jgi:hypothetical protein
VDRLEEKRKIKAQAYFERKVGFPVPATRIGVGADLTASECRSQAPPEGDR